MVMMTKYVPSALEEYEWDSKLELGYFKYEDGRHVVVSQPLTLNKESLLDSYYQNLMVWIKAEHGYGKRA